MIGRKIEKLEERTRTLMTLLWGIIIGGLIGAGIALLTAPRSGLETRELLRSKTQEVKEKALETADQTRVKAEELIRSGEETLNQQMATVKGAVEGVKEGVRTYSELNQSGKTTE